MAAVVLLHTALDNLLNEMLPVDFKYTSEKGEEWDRERIERSIGLERRLTEVAAAATGLPDIRTGRPDLFAFAMSLKALRDALGPAQRDRGSGGPSPPSPHFLALFAADFSAERQRVG